MNIKAFKWKSTRKVTILPISFISSELTLTPRLAVGDGPHFTMLEGKCVKESQDLRHVGELNSVV